MSAPTPRLRPDGSISAACGTPSTAAFSPTSRAAPASSRRFQPWAAALFKERQDNEGRDRPSGRCLPKTIPDAMLVPNYPWKFVQTPD
jgi:hypothetical protein